MKTYKIELDGISNDKKYQIIKAALSTNETSRTEIARLTDISSATVGKVVSKLIDEGLLTFEKQSLSVGRNTEVLYSNQKTYILIFYYGARKLSINLFDTHQRLIFSSSQPINESIPYEDNVISFESSIYERIMPKLKKSICEVAAITDECELRADYISSHPILPLTPPNTISTYKEYVSRYLCRHNPDKNILYIRITNIIDANLICGGNIIERRNFNPVKISDNEPLDMISRISELVSSIFGIIIPDILLIESDKAFIGKHFIEALNREILQNSRIPVEKMPQIISGKEDNLAIRSAAEEAFDKMVKTLSGIEDI